MDLSMIMSGSETARLHDHALHATTTVLQETILMLMDYMGPLRHEDLLEFDVYRVMELIFHQIKIDLAQLHGATFRNVTFEAVNSGCDMAHMARVVESTLSNTAYPYVERRLRLYRTLEFSIRHATVWLVSAEAGDQDEDEDYDEDEG
jgi:hypothetical protein